MGKPNKFLVVGVWSTPKKSAFVSEEELEEFPAKELGIAMDVSFVVGILAIKQEQGV